MKKLIVIAGPTAIGKTAYAVQVAKWLGTEVVSCDSRQFYTEFRIGVARPTEQELATVRHHFIACRSAAEPYDVYRYEHDALPIIESLLEQYGTAVAVGGSGLYLRALTSGISPMPDPAPGLREELQQRLATEGIATLQRQLQRLDPEYYARVDRNNPARLQRALEVCLTTGRPYSCVVSTPPTPRPYEVQTTVLSTDSTTLRQRINQRVDCMVAEGLIDEARSLTHLRHLNTLNTVGYRELFAAFDGLTTVPEAIEAIKLNTWHYAKKQITWCKKYLTP